MLGVIAGGDVVFGFQVLQRVLGCCLSFPVVAQPVLQPFPRGVGLEVLRYVLGLVRTVFIKAMQDLMGTLPFSLSCVAPPMASVKASPRR